MHKIDYVNYNAEIWNEINECLTAKSTAISHEKYQNAKNGKLEVDCES